MMESETNDRPPAWLSLIVLLTIATAGGLALLALLNGIETVQYP